MSDRVICPKCGHGNSKQRVTCKKCRVNLAKAMMGQTMTGVSASTDQPTQLAGEEQLLLGVEKGVETTSWSSVSFMVCKVLFLAILYSLLALSRILEKVRTRVFEVCPNCDQRGGVALKREIVRTIPGEYFRPASLPWQSEIRRQPAKNVFKVWKWCNECGHKYAEGHREEVVVDFDL